MGEGCQVAWLEWKTLSGSLNGVNSKLTSGFWRRQWHPTPVFLPGESQGWGSLVGFRLWGHTESDATEVS